MLFELSTRELLRTRPDPLTAAQLPNIRGARKTGPPRPPPSAVHRHQTVTVSVSEDTLAVELEDGDARVIRKPT